MRTRAIAIGALVALGLTGCMNSNLAVFDRPQAESDTILAATALQLDPTSTRFLWEGDGRELYAAHRIGDAAELCLAIVTADESQEPMAACSPGGRVGVSFGAGEEYALNLSVMSGELDGWENLAEGLWRKL